MPEHNDLYEYAVIRLVPKVEREEFVNIGLVMFCKRKRWLKMDFSLREDLLTVFCPDIDCEFISANLEAFQQIAAGKKCDSPIAHLETAERFRWLTAVRSSMIQTSRPHPGLTLDLEQTFAKLFTELVR